MSLNFFISSALLNAFVTGLLGFLVILKNRKELINKLFFLMSTSVVLWSLSYWQWLSADNISSALLWSRLLAIASLFIPIFYFHWILTFFNLHNSKKSLLQFLYFIVFIILSFSFSNLFIKTVEQKLYFPFWPIPGILFNIYLIFIYFGLIIYSFFILWRQYKTETNDKKMLVKYIFIGSMVGFGGGATNFFLWYNIPIPPYGNWLVFVYPIVLAIAILKHHLFNIRVITTELLVFVIWVFLFIRFLFSEGIKEWLINGSLLGLTIVFGIILIRSVLREVRHREELEKFSNELKNLNIRLENETNHLTALQDFINSLIESLDFKKIVQTIVNGVSDKFGYIGALLLLVGENEKGRFVYPVAISENKFTKLALKILPKPMEDYRFDVENNPAWYVEVDPALASVVVRTGEIQISENFPDFFSAVPKVVSKTIQKTIGFKASVALPVKSKNKIIGVLVVVSKKAKNSFRHEDIETLETISNQIGVVLGNAELFNEVQELNRYKSELLSIVAHQIKNPLVVIKGYATLIKDKTVSDPALMSDIISKIGAAASKLITLLNNLLDLGHIEDGKMHFEFSEIELNKFLKEIIDDFQFVAKQKNLELIFEPSLAKIYVKGDNYKLDQVFRNLIDNAIKYTEKGWIKIELKIDYPSESVLIVISDSGIGMSKDLIGKLFQKFSRGVDEKLLGSGLGLYISKEIVTAHKGKIWAESEGEGKGSKFYVELPILKSS